MPTGSDAVQAIEARGHCTAINDWEARVELAACFRPAALYEMTDLLYGDFTLKLPGSNNHFLTNPLDLMFHEITASSLVKLDLDGNVIGEPERPYNWAGYILHAAVHKARPDAIPAPKPAWPCPRNERVCYPSPKRQTLLRSNRPLRVRRPGRGYGAVREIGQ